MAPASRLIGSQVGWRMWDLQRAAPRGIADKTTGPRPDFVFGPECVFELRRHHRPASASDFVFELAGGPAGVADEEFHLAVVLRRLCREGFQLFFAATKVQARQHFKLKQVFLPVKRHERAFARAAEKQRRVVAAGRLADLVPYVPKFGRSAAIQDQAERTVCVVLDKQYDASIERVGKVWRCNQQMGFEACHDRIARKFIRVAGPGLAGNAAR